jgi:hypothetical protein
MWCSTFGCKDGFTTKEGFQLKDLAGVSVLTEDQLMIAPPNDIGVPEIVKTMKEYIAPPADLKIDSAYSPTQETDVIEDKTRTMLNTQMVTVKHTGYITSNMKSGEGSFSPEESIQQALIGGVRCFVLQIDHMDVTKKGYEKSNHPTLLVRDSNGKLLSKNSGSIAKVAETLAANAFRPEALKNNEPLILYLHIVRAPNKNREPEEY